jgi:hypothetical protein
MRMTTKRTFSMIAALVVSCALAATAATIPAGTAVKVRLGHAISSATAHTGDSFDGTLAGDVVVGGKTIAKSGAPVKGTVTYAKASGRLKDPGAVTIRLTSIDGNAVSSTSVSRKGQSHTKSNAIKIGGGTAAGALIGGLAGGGKGAAIGAGAGAAAGTGVAAYSGKKDVALSAETAYTFTVR